MAISKKSAVIGKACVACGTCINACPLKAISLSDGVIAKVDEKICVGCGKCAKVCPAAIIEIKEMEVAI